MEGTVRLADGRKPFKVQTVLLHWSRAVGVGRDPPQADRARSRASITTYEGNRNGENQALVIYDARSKCSICQIVTAKKEICVQSALM